MKAIDAASGIISRARLDQAEPWGEGLGTSGLFDPCVQDVKCWRVRTEKHPKPARKRGISAGLSEQASARRNLTPAPEPGMPEE
jgi:hypothetical protein